MNIKKLIISVALLLSANIVNADSKTIFGITDNNFEAALGPVLGYPQDDVLLTGTSIVIGRMEEHENIGSACYIEAGDLDAEDYTYNGQEHHADVRFIGAGCRVHLGNKSQSFIRPIAGLNLAMGNSDVPSLNLNYDFTMPSMALGIEIIPFNSLSDRYEAIKDLSYIIIMDYADNDGGKYKRLQHNITGRF
jgi:hypothetical protein